ncbi:MAG: AAA family ATPase, partial [Spirochaetota bacterium]|nr:AAA family ATPase [Spirochaetota bacterium]
LETIVSLRFNELLEKLSKTGQVAVLIDEYDNPITSNITDIERTKKIKDILKGFYKIIKSCDEYVKFAFLTGVTKFSQVSVFSGLNNLTDITMDRRYSAICGYTEDDIKFSFKNYVTKWSKENKVVNDKILSDIKYWYDGFLFTANGIKVYNPWSVLNYFDKGEFRNYWFETGTPTFLVDLIKKSDSFYLPDLKDYSLESEDFSTFDIENLNPIALLFQTGYITIVDYNEKYSEYSLNFPNREVEDSFIKSLLAGELNSYNSQNLLSKLRKSLQKNDLEVFFESMDTLMSKVDYDLHLKDEKYWQSLFYMILTLLGYKISAEFKTVKGRIDAVIETKTHIYIFEFKTTQSEEIALEQIKEREYFKRFKDSDKQIVLVGSRFIVKEKRIVNKYISLNV